MVYFTADAGGLLQPAGLGDPIELAEAATATVADKHSSDPVLASGGAKHHEI